VAAAVGFVAAGAGGFAAASIATAGGACACEGEAPVTGAALACVCGAEDPDRPDQTINATTMAADTPSARVAYRQAGVRPAFASAADAGDGDATLTAAATDADAGAGTCRPGSPAPGET